MNTQIPFFVKDLEDQAMQTGSVLKYVLPDTTCEETCTIEIKVDRGDAKSFATFNSNTRTIQFAPKSTDAGSYSIEVDLTSKGVPDVKVTYGFFLTVFGALIEEEEGDSRVRNKKPVIIEQPTVLIQESDVDLDVKISEITETGKLVLQFSESLLQISNLTAINSTVLDVEIVSGEDGSLVDYGYTWEASEMEEDFFHIKLVFDDPFSVSTSSSSKDQLKLTFMQRWVFNGSVNSNTIYKGKSLSTEIPPQVSEGLFNSLNALGSSSSSSIQSLMMGNFFLNILMSSSMSALWGMINALQILIHLPIFSIPIPLNAQIFCSTIIAITQFDVLPTETLNEWFFDFDEQDEAQNANFENMDIF